MILQKKKNTIKQNNNRYKYKNKVFNKISMLLEKETYAIKGAAFEVMKHLGTGFLEKVYQSALEREFQLMNIPYEREKRFEVIYKGQPLGEEYIADFICHDKIIVELKAVKQLDDIHRAQIINYLHATNLKVGLLINFGEQSAKIERFVNY